MGNACSASVFAATARSAVTGVASSPLIASGAVSSDIGGRLGAVRGRTAASRDTGGHYASRVESNDEEVREAWAAFCAETSERYVRMKDANGAMHVIAAKYAALSATDRAAVDSLLIHQLEPREPNPDDPWYEDENARFVPLALVDRFAIAAAVPTLRALAAWLEEQSTPGAPYEWAKVNGILGRLRE